MDNVAKNTYFCGGFMEEVKEGQLIVPLLFI